MEQQQKQPEQPEQQHQEEEEEVITTQETTNYYQFVLLYMFNVIYLPYYGLVWYNTDPKLIDGFHNSFMDATTNLCNVSIFTLFATIKQHPKQQQQQQRYLPLSHSVVALVKTAIRLLVVAPLLLLYTIQQGQQQQQEMQKEEQAKECLVRQLFQFW